MYSTWSWLNSFVIVLRYSCGVMIGVSYTGSPGPIKSYSSISVKSTSSCSSSLMPFKIVSGKLLSTSHAAARAFLPLILLILLSSSLLKMGSFLMRSTAPSRPSLTNLRKFFCDDHSDFGEPPKV